MCSPSVALAWRAGYACVGILIGLSVGVVFMVTFHNPPAAYWGLLSGVYSLLSLLLFIYLYVVKEINKRGPSGVVLMLVGIISAVGVAAGVGGFTTYLGLGIIHTLHGDDRPLFQTEYIVCVWSFMTFKWAVTSYAYTVRSMDYGRERTQFLIEEEQEEEEEEEEEEGREGEGGGEGVTYSQLRELEPSFVTVDTYSGDNPVIRDSSPVDQPTAAAVHHVTPHVT